MPRRSTRWVKFGFGAAVGILLTAWWWPGIVGDQGSSVIVISASRSDDSASEVLNRRFREEGMSTSWEVRPSENCSIPSPGTREASVFVVLLSHSASCDPRESVEALSRLVRSGAVRRVLAVVSWRESDDSSSLASSLRDQNVEVVDPRSFIGAENSSQPCQWWDDCGPTGTVRTIEDGELTQAGQERLARFIVSGVL